MLSGGLEYSAGGVVLGPNALVALSTHRKTGVSLPKGHVDEGETALQAALRELLEEAGISARRLTVACRLGTFTRVGSPAHKGHALTDAVTCALPDGIVEFEGRTDRKKLNRRYVLQRRPNGDLYLHVEWPQKSSDVLMRFWKPANGNWTVATYAWERKGGGWRRMTSDEERLVRKELAHVELTPRGEIPVLDDLKQIRPGRWRCEFGTITRKTVPEAEDPQAHGHRWSFEPRGTFADQAFPGLEQPSAADLLRILRWNVLEGPTFTADPVLARFRPLDAGRSRDSEFKVVELFLGSTTQAVLKPIDERHTEAGWYPFDQAHDLLSTVRPVDAKQLLIHRPAIEQLQGQILGTGRGGHETSRRTRHLAPARPPRAQVVAV